MKKNYNTNKIQCIVIHNHSVAVASYYTIWNLCSYQLHGMFVWNLNNQLFVTLTHCKDTHYLLIMLVVSVISA